MHTVREQDDVPDTSPYKADIELRRVSQLASSLAQQLQALEVSHKTLDLVSTWMSVRNSRN